MRGRGLRGCCGNSSSKPSNIFPTINAGTYRHRVTIQTPNLVPDNRGGGVYNWSDVATVYARIETFKASEYRNISYFQQGQQQGRNAYVVYMRYRDNLTTAMRLSYNFQALQIDSIVNVDSLNWELQLYCREVDPGEL